MTGRVIRMDRSHLEIAADVLTQAFARDPMAKYVFAVSKASFEDSGKALFNYSCEVRLLLEWPLLGVIEEDESLVGVAGLSLPGDPIWPPALHQVYKDLKTAIGAESAARLERYAELADTNRPSEPHYQLGMIGVTPKAQGKGYGGLMLQEVHDIAENDLESTGVWLDTETVENVSFYQHHGYEIRALTALEDLNIWGMFRPNPG